MYDSFYITRTKKLSSPRSSLFIYLILLFFLFFWGHYFDFLCHLHVISRPFLEDYFELVYQYVVLEAGPELVHQYVVLEAGSELVHQKAQLQVRPELVHQKAQLEKEDLVVLEEMVEDSPVMLENFVVKLLNYFPIHFSFFSDNSLL